MGIKEILVYDDTFTINKKRVVEICNEILRRNIDVVWDIRARVNTVDKDTLFKLKKAGCERIHYGVESGNQKILNVGAVAEYDGSGASSDKWFDKSGNDLPSLFKNRATR